jgi:hypothetical protein
VAEMVREGVPGSTLSFADGAGPDLRNYRVDFSKLETTFPDLHLSCDVRSGVDELVRAFSEHELNYEDFESSRFVRLRRVSELLEAGLVDDMLRRRTSGWLVPSNEVLAQRVR